MNERLLEIIKYKTGGKQNAFAELMGWSPQYLAKLIRGGNFGLQPVLAILSVFPEINARWFLFGQGSMLEAGVMFNLQRLALSYIQSLLDFDKYIPVMRGNEMRELEDAIKNGRYPNFPPDTLIDFQKRLTERNDRVNAILTQASAKSDSLCKQHDAKE